MYLRRRATFSAGYLGASSGKPGGHNFICELCVSGAIDPVTGMVVNITDVDAVLKAAVVHKLDGVLLDRDVPELIGLMPTDENIARFIWDACIDKLPPHPGSATPLPSEWARGLVTESSQSTMPAERECRLSGVTLYSKPTAWVTLSRPRDEETIMLTVTRAYDFSASHRLHAPALGDAENAAIFGKCNRENGHGHNYEVEITVAGDVDASTGRVTDPEAMDKIVEEVILLPFDHRHLNMDVPEFADVNPTSENLTRVIWDRLNARWDGDGKLYRVVVRETARNYFEYYGPDGGA